eukprot:2103544-Alexandrium_andersonii.AAC.1
MPPCPFGRVRPSSSSPCRCSGLGHDLTSWLHESPADMALWTARPFAMPLALLTPLAPTAQLARPP